MNPKIIYNLQLTTTFLVTKDQL